MSVITSGWPTTARYAESLGINGLRTCLEDRPGGKGAKRCRTVTSARIEERSIRSSGLYREPDGNRWRDDLATWVGWTSRTLTTICLPPSSRPSKWNRPDQGTGVIRACSHAGPGTLRILSRGLLGCLVGAWVTTSFCRSSSAGRGP